MSAQNDFFTRMCREAQDELARGDRSWRDIGTNTLVLACFGMLSNHLTTKLSRPLWFFATAVASGAIAYIVKQFLGG